MLPSKSHILPCKMLYTVMLHSLYQRIPKKVETKWSYKNLKLLFDIWGVWRIKYVDIVWREGEKYSKMSLTDFKILKCVDLLVIFSLKWNTPRENTQWQTELFFCVTTVFNKLSILGSKLSLALEERSKRVPMGCLTGAELNGKRYSKPGQRSHKSVFT